MSVAAFLLPSASAGPAVMRMDEFIDSIALNASGIPASSAIQPQLLLWQQGAAAKPDMGIESCWHQASG